MKIKKIATAGTLLISGAAVATTLSCSKEQKAIELVFPMAHEEILNLVVNIDLTNLAPSDLYDHIVEAYSESTQHAQDAWNTFYAAKVKLESEKSKGSETNQKLLYQQLLIDLVHTLSKYSVTYNVTFENETTQFYGGGISRFRVFDLLGNEPQTGESGPIYGTKYGFTINDKKTYLLSVSEQYQKGLQSHSDEEKATGYLVKGEDNTLPLDADYVEIDAFFKDYNVRYF